MVVENVMPEYIPREIIEYKEVLVSIKSTYRITGKIPTIGSISQMHNTNNLVQKALSEIKYTTAPDNLESVIMSLEMLIKSVRMEPILNKVTKMYLEGQVSEAGIFAEEKINEINKFSLKGTVKKRKRVFEDFQKEMYDRSNKLKDKVEDIVNFGVDPLDDVVEGLPRKNTALIILPVGFGKSTILKWIGLNAVRCGHDVLHFQLEGDEDETMSKYTQVWTAASYRDVRTGGLIDSDKFENLIKTAEYFQKKGVDIEFESFGKLGGSVVEIKRSISDYEKIHGRYPRLVIIDYLQLIDPFNGTKALPTESGQKKMWIQHSSNAIKSMAEEYNISIVVAAQAHLGGDNSYFENNKKVIDETKVAGDKNALDPYTIGFSGNQTRDEKKVGKMRLGILKGRYSKFNHDPITIYTAYDYGRFYDRQKTKRLLNGG